MTIARYDVNNANVNRHVRFKVQSESVGDRDAGLFLSLKGEANVYPFYGQLVGTPTANQELAQLRISLVVRALTIYTIAIGVQVSRDDADTGTPAVGSALNITFEADEFGAYFNQLWTGDQTLAKHLVTDIVDAVGIGGFIGPFAGGKTKDGLTTLLDSLATVSFDGGTTGPFGALSTTGAITLPDGQVTAGAPTLAAGGSPSGLAITYLEEI